MDKILLLPPVAFIVILTAVLLASRLFSRLAFRAKKHTDGGGKAYACGESNYDNLAQIDYTSFFPFAFFFALGHVATLIITTVPTETLQAFVIATTYIFGAILGLYILFRK